MISVIAFAILSFILFLFVDIAYIIFFEYQKEPEPFEIGAGILAVLFFVAINPMTFIYAAIGGAIGWGVWHNIREKMFTDFQQNPMIPVTVIEPQREERPTMPTKPSYFQPQPLEEQGDDREKQLEIERKIASQLRTNIIKVATETENDLIDYWKTHQQTLESLKDNPELLKKAKDLYKKQEGVLEPALSDLVIEFIKVNGTTTGNKFYNPSQPEDVRALAEIIKQIRERMIEDRIGRNDDELRKYWNPPT